MAYENALIIIILFGLVFFGSKKLPELARTIGRSQMEFEIARSESMKQGQKEIPARYLRDRPYRAKLEKAALSAGVQDPKSLTDKELVYAIASYLEET